MPGLDVAAAYRPAGDGEEVGGDFYDIFEIADGDWVVAVGDVCGKGVDAAVVTALVPLHDPARRACRSTAPSAAAAPLNEVLLAHGTERFCTVVLAAAAPRRRRLDGRRSSSGGHPLPLLVRPATGWAPSASPGSLLGVVEQPDVPRPRASGSRPGDLPGRCTPTG